MMIANIRKVESIRRVALPTQLSKMLNINPGDYVNIYAEGKKIIIEKMEDKHE